MLRNYFLPPRLQPQAAPPSVTLFEAGKRTNLFTLPPTKAPDRDSVVIFSMPKSGTILLAGISAALAREQRLTFVSVLGEFYKKGLLSTEIPEEAANIFLPKGYCYGGLATFPESFDIPILGKCRSILIVRDPRDMLVSLYYSVKFSHPAPGAKSGSDSAEMPGRAAAQNADIDTYVISQIADFQQRLKRYAAVANEPGMRVYRYEDVIYKKREWVGDICQHFGWKVPAIRQIEIADKSDVFPSTENEQSHVRQVHPGNYKAKLKPATIAAIEDAFAAEMDFFGYA